MDPTDSAVSASTSYKTEEGNHSTNGSSHRVVDSLEDSSDSENDSRSVDEERDRASASDADDECDSESSEDDSHADELCCGGSPKSPTGKDCCTIIYKSA